MSADEIAILRAQMEANRQETSERIDRVCENQRRFEQKVDELLGLGKGLKRFIMYAGALAGTIGGSFFAYVPQIIKFLDHVLNAV
ncbi:hypothetical protein FAI40_01570 [Acetobacteraceae bacterium]|nr:hypothetical protein FAI40_01570 [Acetobacteraceae bacterium]